MAEVVQPIQRAQAANYMFKNRKVFNDPVLGHIEIHPVCVRIIDTPQFQRLRYIKQLDACYLIYPGASHNRFEHSIGTCYLAGKLLRAILERQPEEEITERDILCVEIAALCHDIGQGPFSHVFEQRFMPQMGRVFTHEETGRKMFDFMLKDNDGELKKDIQDIIRKCDVQGFDSLSEDDFLFIKEMIDKPKDLDGEEWPYAGRDESKSFLYEIVANKRTGIDVDKWDYLARDSYMLGIQVNFDHNRCFISARVLKSNGQNNGVVRAARKQICYRDKDAHDLYDLFYTRLTLHRKAYQHKTHRIIGMMICEALLAANDSIRFIGKDGRDYRISDAVDDMKAYTMLTDDIFHFILNAPPNGNVILSSDTLVTAEGNDERGSSEKVDKNVKRERADNLKRAKGILNNIIDRKLYKCIAEGQIKLGNFDVNVLKEIVTPRQMQADFIRYDIVHLDYGMADRDPMANARFYTKKEDNKAIKLDKSQVSYVLPENFSEHIVRIYCTHTGNGEHSIVVSEVKENFKNWCDNLAK